MAKAITAPTVERIAHTSVNIPEYSRLRKYMELDEESVPFMDVIEFAGRSCYQSFHKPNPATAENADYIEHIISQGHESVLEHASATYYIQGVSRNCTHELIRHRHLSYSQQSQRFVNESSADIVLPPALAGSKYEELDVEELLGTYEEIVESLMESGLARKQAREAARFILPGGTETRIVVTGNFRAWRDFLWKRLDPQADAEIRRLAFCILKDLFQLAPPVFQDLVDVYGGTEDD